MATSDSSDIKNIMPTLTPSFEGVTPIWEYLKSSGRPIVLYGTGNGADKILDVLSGIGLSTSGIFASDGFVRSRSFRGFPVENYASLKARFPDMIVLVAFGSGRKEVLDNIDRISSECEVYAPDVPVYGKNLFDRAFYLSHEDELSKVGSMLEDQLSKDTFRALLSYKLSGDYRLLRPVECPSEEISKILSPKAGTFVDLGAYTGDTVSFYTSLFPDLTRVLAVEPDPRNFRKLAENTKDMPDVRLFQALVSDHDGTGLVPKNRGRGVHEMNPEENGMEIPSVSLSSLLSGETSSLIKFDVEGNELLAINGGAEVLLRDKPDLIVSCYHRSEDLFTLPLRILEIVPDYHVFLRHHPHLLCWDTEYIFTRNAK